MSKLITKKNFCDKDEKRSSYYFMGFPFLTKTVTVSEKRTKILGICVRRKTIKTSQEILQEPSSLKKEIESIKNTNIPVILWFDHSWGGGTETYTKNQFKKLAVSNLCIRIQGFRNKTLKVSYIFKDKTATCEIKEEQLPAFFEKMNKSLIVVNNLAGYYDEIEFLSKISDLKQQLKSYVSFRGHDFQCICPSITMTNDTGRYCNCKNLKQCITCHPKIRENLLIFTESIKSWQAGWKNFLENTADEIVVFSNSTKEIFTNAYPKIESKIKIIPHEVTPLRHVQIPKHSGFNIGVLGAISHAKGAEIISQMDTLLPKYPQVSINIVGTLRSKTCEHVKVLGKYTPSKLPDIIEKNKIDIIFIPSIWPETFSYTTSEAMIMGMPVACFNLGAPAERVKNYEKGLVLKEINPVKNIQEIKNFVKQLRKGIQ